MKTFLTRRLFSLAVVVSLLAGLCLASPQKASRIQRLSFASGQTSVILSGRLKPYTNHVYRLSARSGQRMTVHLQSPPNDVVFWIQSKRFIHERSTFILEGIDKGGVTDWTGELPFTGEYEIYISNPPISDHAIKLPLSYKLELEIK